MNCKFHPEAKAVTKCAVCGAEMCSECGKSAFYRDKDSNEPLCLECSLKAAKEDLEEKENNLKRFFKNGLIACGIWIGGIIVGAIANIVFIKVSHDYGYGSNAQLVISLGSMLGAAIFLSSGAIFMPTTEKKDFFARLKSVFWNIVIFTFFLPLCFILFSIMDKISVYKAGKKVKEIKDALGIAN